MTIQQLDDDVEMSVRNQQLKDQVAENIEFNPTDTPGIKFDNVTFGWSKKETLLQQVSFQFAPGDKVAIVGKVGSGKSSLLLAML